MARSPQRNNVTTASTVTRVAAIDPVIGLQQLQDNLYKVLSFYTAKDQLNSLMLPGIVLQSGSNEVSHKLGRELVSYYLLDQDNLSAIFSTQASNPHPELTLYLTATAPCTITLLVF